MFICGVKGVVGRWGIEMIKRRPVPLLPLQEKHTETAGNEDPPGQISETIPAKKPLQSNKIVFAQNPNLKQL